jgi:hypothetical protein
LVKKLLIEFAIEDECVGFIKSNRYNIIKSKCCENCGKVETTTISSAISGSIAKIVKKLNPAA